MRVLELTEEKRDFILESVDYLEQTINKQKELITFLDKRIIDLENEIKVSPRILYPKPRDDFYNDDIELKVYDEYLNDTFFVVKP